MATTRYEENGVVLELGIHSLGLTSVMIAVPLYGFKMTAHRSPFDGQSWSYRARMGADIVDGDQAPWRHVYEKVPLKLTSRSGEKPTIHVARMFREYVDMHARVARPRELESRSRQLQQLADNIAADNGDPTIVEIIRSAAAKHGYRLEPDVQLGLPRRVPLSYLL